MACSSNRGQDRLGHRDQHGGKAAALSIKAEAVECAQVVGRINYLPTTSISKDPGTTVGHPPTVTGGPNFAVGR